MLEHLDCMLSNTTRRGQLVAAECLGRLVKRWRLPADMTAGGGHLCQEVFRKAANILSALLIVPRYAQLRTETLQVSCTDSYNSILVPYVFISRQSSNRIHGSVTIKLKPA